MNKDLLYGILIFIGGMLVALAFIAHAYFRFQRSLNLSLKVAQQSPKWKKIQRILEQSFGYYQHLPDSMKADFTRRTLQFMRRCRWISAGSTPVSTEQKVLISAAATQLTFGLKESCFGRFKTILLHDDAYYNRLTRRYHRGEVNQGGLIVLSWKHFEEGYADAGDKINLGLHEMAHALDLALLLSQGRRYNIHRLMDKFRQSAFEEIIAMRHRSSNFLRSYAATNPREFFSVAVEHFFEAPALFRAKLPDLYIEMCQLLNQDPFNAVYRGYKSPHSTLYSNRFEKQTLQHTKPSLQLNPNAHIVIPFASLTLLFGLSIPVFKTLTPTETMLPALTLGIIYLVMLILLYNAKAKKLLLASHHLISYNLLIGNQRFSVHLKNVINISFTYMLTYYRAEINFFEGEEIRSKSLSLYFSPACIKKLERLLLQQNLKIKHNNRWLRK